MKVLAIIPARKGSKGIPGKNIKSLGGIPLVGHTISAAQGSSHVTDIVVSTDDTEVINIANSYGVRYEIRGDEYADDFTPLLPDVLYHVLDQVGYSYDVVLVLEPTYPFRSSSTIDKVVEKVLKKDCDWVVTVSPVRDHPHRCRIIKNDNLIPFVSDCNVFKQRQDLPKVYMMRGSVYGATVESVKECKSLSDCSWRGVIINSREGVDIDEPLDFSLAEGIVYEDK
jgi:N-acylneuraminate cytidylyltransferase